MPQEIEVLNVGKSVVEAGATLIVEDEPALTKPVPHINPSIKSPTISFLIIFTTP